MTTATTVKERVATGPTPRVMIGELPGDLKIKGGEVDGVSVETADVESLDLRVDEGVVTVSGLGDLRLIVPLGASLDLRAVRGDLRIGQVGGAIQVGEVAGDLMLREVGPTEVGAVFGDLSAKQVAGSLKVGNIYGDAAAREVRGDVELGSVGADLRVNGCLGSLRAQVGADASIGLPEAAPAASEPGADPGATLGADVAAALRGRRYEVHAGADILLRVPEGVGATLRARGGAGEVDVRLADARVEAVDGAERVTIGDGSLELDLVAGGKVVVAGAAGEGWQGERMWQEMGADFRSMATEFAQRMEAQISMMTGQISERLAHLSEALPEVLAAAGLSADEAERIALRVRVAGDRAAERARRGVEEANRQVARHMDQAQRQAERQVERQARQQAVRVVHAPPPPPPPPTAPSTGGEERLLILRMLEQGKITVDDATRLMAAMEGRGGGEA